MKRERRGEQKREERKEGGWVEEGRKRKGIYIKFMLCCQAFSI